MDPKEHKKRIRLIKMAIRKTVAELRTADDAALDRAADNIAVLAANLKDAIAGRPAYAYEDRRGRGLSHLTAARGSTTRKIRKALGYTYP